MTFTDLTKLCSNTHYRYLFPMFTESPDPGPCADTCSLEPIKRATLGLVFILTNFTAIYEKPNLFIILEYLT